jgi:hypothetical protein
LTGTLGNCDRKKIFDNPQEQQAEHDSYFKVYTLYFKVYNADEIGEIWPGASSYLCVGLSPLIWALNAAPQYCLNLMGQI